MLHYINMSCMILRSIRLHGNCYYKPGTTATLTNAGRYALLVPFRANREQNLEELYTYCLSAGIR